MNKQQTSSKGKVGIGDSSSIANKDSCSILSCNYPCNNPSFSCDLLADYKKGKDYFLSEDNNIPSLTDGYVSERGKITMLYDTTIINQEILREWSQSMGLPLKEEEKRTEKEINEAVEKIINTTPITPVNDFTPAIIAENYKNLDRICMNRNSIEINNFPVLFDDPSYRTSFYCTSVGKKAIAVSNMPKTNGNTTLRSYNLTFTDGTEKVITLKRIIKKGKDGTENKSYDILTASNSDDRLVMVQTQLGKRKPATNYDEDLINLQKSLNNFLDKMVKFTESYSDYQYLDKNHKEGREIKKKAEKLINLINNSR